MGIPIDLARIRSALRCRTVEPPHPHLALELAEAAEMRRPSARQVSTASVVLLTGYASGQHIV